MTEPPRRIPRGPAYRALLAELGVPAGATVRRIGPSVLNEPWAGVVYEALALVEGSASRELMTIVGHIESPAYWETRYRTNGRPPIVALRGIEAVDRARWLVDGFKTWRGRPPGRFSVEDPEAELRRAYANVRRRVGERARITQLNLATEIGVERSAVSKWLKALHLTIADLR
jgi:hypothetical protein